MSGEEKKKEPEFSGLYVDIGAAGREEAANLVCPGDRIYFESEYIEFGDGFITAKAIDDRFGCAVLLELLERETSFGCVIVFTVQEEVGLRGARAAAGTVNPDFAVIIEATTAADIPLVSGSDRCCALGGGAVTAFMDKSAIYDKELFEISKNIAKASNIGWQTKTVIAGGNDAGAVQTNGGGARTIAVSAPCRYLHSPSCVVKRTDLEDCLHLTGLLSERIYQYQTNRR
jgi:endoglucanase